MRTKKEKVNITTMMMMMIKNADGGGTYSVYDTDSDGYLDRTEYVKFYDSKRKRSKNFHFMDYLTIYSNFQGNHQY